MKDKLFIISKYYLIFVAFSFLGWLFEVVQMFIVNGYFYNSGFLFLPFCPIYGTTIMLIYLLFGTINEPRLLLKKIKNKYLLIVLYFLIAFLIPTLIELLVGYIFDKHFNIILWTYKSVPLNINGYVSVIVSLMWALLIVLIMNFVFPFIKKIIFKIPDILAFVISLIVGISMLVDFIINIIIVL